MVTYKEVRIENKLIKLYIVVNEKKGGISITPWKAKYYSGDIEKIDVNATIAWER